MLQAVMASAFVTSAVAQGDCRDPALRRAEERLDRVRGPERIVALRRLWALWDRVDPTTVQADLDQLSQSQRLDPPSRAYAGLLGAFAQVRRGDLLGARRRIEDLGYVHRWLVVGPFDNEGKNGFDTAYGPELELDQGIVPGRTYPGKERPVAWRAVPEDAFPYGWLDFGALLRPQTKICAYATTYVQSSSTGHGQTPISAWVGATGAFRLFVNGQALLEDGVYRKHDVDRFATEVALRPGLNQVTVKVCGDDLQPMLSLRLADVRGQPDPSIRTTNQVPSHAKIDRGKAKRAAVSPRTSPETRAAPAKARAHGVQGPLTLLSQRAAAKNASADDLFAYAEYLAVTDGDDPTRHVARDITGQAIDKAPTVDRMLLMAGLAEDRNQQAVWIERAQALADKQGKPDVRILLARAELERTGPSPQLAFPTYEQTLALDPDNVDALVGRAELYSLVGMPRTGLASIDRALERHPTSVRLLGARAEKLRDLGRTTEAMETEQLYSNFRFDDAAWLSHVVDLSLARHTKDSAVWWAKRAVEMNPSGQWSLGLLARTYRNVGEPERAIAEYEHALSLAPEDTGTLRALSDLQGELGHRSQQIALLRHLLEVSPQDADTRNYVEHLEPKKAHADERFAWQSARFLPLRHAPSQGNNRRTLRDLTVTTVFQNGLSSTFRQIVFQPLTDAAAASSRQYAFDYESDRQVVQLRGARVYRGDGTTDEAIESGEAPVNDPSIALYTSARTFYVQFPRLEPKDVVELRYRVEDVSPRNEFADYFGDFVALQSDEPVFNAEYVLVTPKSRRMFFDTNLGALLSHQVEDRTEQRVDRFFAPRLPAIEPEPLMPPYPELVGFVHASTFDSWQTMGRWYWDFIKDQFDVDEEMRDLARRITEGKQTDFERVRAIYDWVVENTRYVALEFGVYGYKPHRAVQTVTRGWGDCKDKAAVIVTLLKTLGIDASMVIVRTRLRGDFHSKIASLAPFDHAIAYVPSLNLYLDGTAEGTGIGEFPVMDRGAMALRLQDGNAKLVHLPIHGTDPDLVERTVTSQLDAGGGGSIEVHTSVQGETAPEWRHTYEAEATRRDRVAAELGAEFPGFLLQPGPTGLVTSGLDDIDEPVKMVMRGHAPRLARREGARLNVTVTPNLRLTPTYASLSERHQDLVILSFPARQDTFVIRLAPHQKVLSLPAASAKKSEFGSYSVEVQSQPTRVVVRTRLALDRLRIHPEEYPRFREFCTDVDRALDQRLIVGATR